VDLGISQPLLRNFGIFFNRSQIMIAMNNLSLSEYEFKQSVIDTVAEAENLYWDLTFAITDVQVSIQSYELAEDLVEINQAKVDVGTLPPVEVLKARSTAAARKETIISSKNEMKAVRDRVFQIADMPQLREDVDYDVEPADKPEVVPLEVDQIESIQVALRERPDYLGKKVEIENRDIELRVAKNQLLPILDLEASLGSNGLGSNYAKDFDALGTTRYYNWSTALAFSVPLGNRLARSTYERRRLEVERALIELKDLEQEIIVQVRGAVRDINSFLEQVRAARVARELAAKQLSQEQQRLDVGRATTHDVLEYQEDYAQAQRSEMRAIVDYLKSLVALERTKGTLLEKRNVVLDGLSLDGSN
jgi:outer membrane protein